MKKIIEKIEEWVYKSIVLGPLFFYFALEKDSLGRVITPEKWPILLIVALLLSITGLALIDFIIWLFDKLLESYIKSEGYEKKEK